MSLSFVNGTAVRGCGVEQAQHLEAEHPGPKPLSAPAVTSAPQVLSLPTDQPSERLGYAQGPGHKENPKGWELISQDGQADTGQAE